MHPAVYEMPYLIQKSQVEKKRVADCKNVIEEMKSILISKRYRLPEQMTSQELILFEVVMVLKRVDLKLDFSKRVLRTTPEKMTREERQELKKTREQYRRNKIDAACSHLEEFLIMNNLNGTFGSKLTRLQMLQLVRDHLKVLPDVTSPAPLSPSLKHSIAGILASRKNSTPSSFIDMPVYKPVETEELNNMKYKHYHIMSSQSITIAAPIVPLPLVVARLYSVYVKGEYMNFLLNDVHQKSGLVLLITSQMAPVLHILGLEAPSLNMPSRDLVDYVNELNTLVSDFHRNAPNYSFGDFSLDYCTTDTLLAILEFSKRCADVGSLRGGATGAKVFGNLSERQMAVTCGELNIGEKDRFIDIGCEYGQLMCTVAALTQAEMSTGIEYQKHIYDAGVLHLQFFKNLMKFFGKRHGNIKIEYGDVTEEKNHSMVTLSTFIFANNIAFRDLNDQLKKIFLNCRNSTQIVSTDPFFSMRTSGKEGKFDTHFNKKDELFKICKVRSVKEKQLEVVKKNTDWKTKSTELYLITINRKVSEEENEPVEKMEYEEAASGNVQNNTVPMDVVYRGNEKKKDDCGRKSTRIARRPFSVKFKTQKVQKSKRIPPQKPIKLRKPACETMVPCQNECCITKIKFSKKAGRYQFVLHAFIHSENQFDTFWDCNVCGFRYESYVENESLLMSTYLDPRFSYVPDLLMRVRWTEIEESIALYSESLIIVPTSAQPPVPKKAHVEESSYAKFVQSKRLSVGGNSIQAEMASYKALVVAGRPALDSDPVTFCSQR
ncbi:hypothetical protein L5515_017345 [Caenorhabditis briggsae]|uniref:Histone-lysine N-methyltransferase, H3 lysine-79 specific n=1 Tax=Caenorhabditis briggsae TaxID=6238 RepID=A0AAE9F955_CAEBR|nr:hypothetical protein L5515_017345 [Caenorhabditis briggsae]